MQYELWNTRNDIRVAIWPSEQDARTQVKQQPGIASEPHRLLVRGDDDATEVVAEQDQLLAWADVSQAV